MKKIAIILFVFIPFILNADECDNKLAAALKKKTASEQLAALLKLEKKCGNHIPLLITIADQYSSMGNEAGEQWIRLALTYYQRAFDLDSLALGARSGLAAHLEYIGEYAKALPHLLWLENKYRQDNKAEKANDMHAHALACKFVIRNAWKKDQDALGEKTSVSDIAGLDYSGGSITNKCGFAYLQNLEAAIALSSGLSTTDGDGQYIQLGLAFLFDWMAAPLGDKPEKRNRLFVGLLSTINSMIAERNLADKLSSYSKVGALNGVLPKNFGGTFEEAFRKISLVKERKFTISTDLAVVEKWDVFQIAGLWLATCLGCTAYPEPAQCGCGPHGVQKIKIVQNGSEAHIEAPETIKQLGITCTYKRIGNINAKKFIENTTIVCGGGKGAAYHHQKIDFDILSNKEMIGTWEHTSEGFNNKTIFRWRFTKMD